MELAVIGRQLPGIAGALSNGRGICLTIFLYNNGFTHSEKCSSQDGFNVHDFTDVLYRCDGADPMYIVTNGSDEPFGSFDSNSFASITSTFNRISGGFFMEAA